MLHHIKACLAVSAAAHTLLMSPLNGTICKWSEKQILIFSFHSSHSSCIVQAFIFVFTPMQFSFDFLSILDLSVSVLRGPQTEEAVSVCRERTKLSSYLYLLFRRYTISQRTFRRTEEALGGIARFPIFPSLQQLVKLPIFTSLH